MEWIPDDAWLTYLRLETEAEYVLYDLSVGVGSTPPSFVDAGFMRLEPNASQLEAVGLRWVLDEPALSEFALTTEQIEALGFEQASSMRSTAVTFALIALLVGALGGALVVALTRPVGAAGESTEQTIDAENGRSLKHAGRR